jgi:hypothetical protein
MGIHRLTRSEVGALVLGLCIPFAGSWTLAKAGKIRAQKILEETAAKHSELDGLELNATAPNGTGCSTIASTEAKDLGERCDKEDYSAMRTNKPSVEKEKGGFDVTLPLHDADGKVIGVVGMDFKPQPGQVAAGAVAQGKQIAAGIEKQIPSKEKLYEPVD